MRDSLALGFAAVLRPAMLLIALCLLAMPAAALAQSAGDEQYTDPFGESENPADTQAQGAPAPESEAAPAAPAEGEEAVASQQADSPALPATGGPAALLAGGGALLLAGGAALRRRAS
jgi:hypothetical protein